MSAHPLHGGLLERQIDAALCGALIATQQLTHEAPSVIFEGFAHSLGAQAGYNKIGLLQLETSLEAGYRLHVPARTTRLVADAVAPRAPAPSESPVPPVAASEPTAKPYTARWDRLLTRQAVMIVFLAGFLSGLYVARLAGLVMP